MYRQRFGLTGHPLPKNAQGKTFFDKSPGFKKLERAFRQLIADPGLGVLTADAGVGKTAALRHLCAQLPKPDYLVIYLCAAVGPFDFYRALAVELGLRPAHRRAELWASLKKSLLHLVDERGIAPILAHRPSAIDFSSGWPTVRRGDGRGEGRAPGLRRGRNRRAPRRHKDRARGSRAWAVGRRDGAGRRSCRRPHRR